MSDVRLEVGMRFVLALATALAACKSEVSEAQCRSFCGRPTYTQAECDAIGAKAECESSSAIAPQQAAACGPDGGTVASTGCNFTSCASTPECGN